MSRYMSQLIPKKGDVNRIYVLLILESSIFLTKDLKKLYEFTVICRISSFLVPKKGGVNRMSNVVAVV